MDAGYHLILSDIGVLTDENNDLYIYFFNTEDTMREKYILLLSILFILSSCCGVYLCLLKDTYSQKKIIYNVVEPQNNI